MRRPGPSNPGQPTSPATAIAVALVVAASTPSSCNGWAGL